MDITVAEVDKLLAIAKWLKSPPPLPDRKADLWEKAQADAKGQLTEEAKARTGQIISRPGWFSRPRRATEQQKQRNTESFKRNTERRAATLYRQLDPEYAEAEKERAKSINKSILQFTIVVAPIRGDLPRLWDGGQSSCWFLGQLPVTDYETEWALSQSEWHSLWLQTAPRIVYELEKMKRILAAEIAGAKRPRPTRKKPHGTSQQRGNDDFRLLLELVRDYKERDKSIAYAPPTQTVVATRLGWAQYHVSKAATRQFPPKGWKTYLALIRGDKTDRFTATIITSLSDGSPLHVQIAPPAPEDSLDDPPEHELEDD